MGRHVGPLKILEHDDERHLAREGRQHRAQFLGQRTHGRRWRPARAHGPSPRWAGDVRSDPSADDDGSSRRCTSSSRGNSCCGFAAGFAALRANRPQRRRLRRQAQKDIAERGLADAALAVQDHDPAGARAHVFERFRQHRQFAIAIQEQAMGTVARRPEDAARPSGTKA